MKHKIIILCTVACFACIATNAQSSVGKQESNDSKPLIVEGKKFPMTAAEYQSQKAADNAKRAQAAEQKRTTTPEAKKEAVKPAAKKTTEVESTNG